MQFRILGSLQVCDGDDEVPVRGTKQRALLGLLLLQPNQPVSEDVLIESLWGDEPSARAADNLHVLVSRLRRILGTDRLLREGAGYLIRIDEGDLDVATFERLRGEGKLREALELWRGDALADFTYEGWAQNEIRRLEELRLATLEERIERDLAAGVDGELVGELQGLVAEHPLREALRRHLIVALYRSERQAEALEAYRDARRMLDEELGLEPSPALRELEGAVLRHDRSLERPRAAPAISTTRARRPAALVVAALALVGSFAAAIATIRVLDGDEAPRAAAAATTAKGKAQL
ncbi:MAG: AfsR/SARP family transcriptional regulator, partial [Gaiellaceae bacterium]